MTDPTPADWTVDRVVRGKLYLWAPERSAMRAQEKVG